MLILFIILAFVVIFLVMFLRGETVYLYLSIDLLNKYFCVLKYRGIADESILQNGTMNISSIKDNINERKTVGITKYKERGSIGFYLIVKEEDLGYKINIFIRELKKKDIYYFLWENNGKNIYVIDLKQNFKQIKKILEYLWNKIFNYNDMMFDINFADNICKDSSKIIDFKDAKELGKKGINIDIPITDWERFIYKLKRKKTRP